MSLDYEIYDLGDVKLQKGAMLRDCKLAFKTFGTLNAAKDNVIVYPTWYSGQHYDNEWLIGPGLALVVRQPNHLEGAVAFDRASGVVVNAFAWTGKQAWRGIVFIHDEVGVRLIALEGHADDHLA